MWFVGSVNSTKCHWDEYMSFAQMSVMRFYVNLGNVNTYKYYIRSSVTKCNINIMQRIKSNQFLQNLHLT